MTGYKVVHAFADSCDAGYVYRTGDTYPREGYEPDPVRVADLESTANALGFPVIEKEPEPAQAAAEKPAKAPAKKTNTKGSKKP